MAKAKVRVKNHSRKVNKKIAKVQVLGMDAAVRFLEKKTKKALTDPYSNLKTEVDSKKKTGIVGFDKVGHYRKKKYQNRSILAKTLFGNIRGIVRAYRRKAKKK